MKPIVRVLLTTDSHDPVTFKSALGVADEICKRSEGSIRQVILLVHTNAQLDERTLVHLIGPGPAKLLSKGSPMALPSGARVHRRTMRTIGHLAAKTVVVGYYADMKMLDAIDGMPNVAGVVAVPDLPDEADAWEARWSPIVHGREKRVSKPLINDPVIERALESLSSIVNLSTGLGHPRDKTHASDTLRILRNKGHRAERAGIQSWAIRRGWKPGQAEELAKLAERILGMKTKPDLGNIYDPEGKYARWKGGEDA